MNSVFFWTNLILFLEKIFQVLENSGYDGIIVIWILGIFLIIAYVVFFKEDYTKLLMVGTQKIMRAEEAIRKIKILLELIDERKSKKSFGILLKGYIYHHEESCEFKECPLKIYKKRMLENPNTVFEDENKLLISHCNHLYEITLLKFPKHTQLRIFYAMFLFERMKNINLSKMQLSLASSENPNLTEEFSIYRLNKIITEEFFNQDDENPNLDIASTIAFDRFMKKFKQEIEKIGFSYIDFWNSFVQDDINIGKIRSLGFKINELIKSVFLTWDCMQTLNQNDKESLRLYGQFLIDILNEKSNGQEYIDKSKEGIKNQSIIKFFKNDIFSLSTDGSPCILASPNENKGAIITQMTLSASRLFGYDKQELIGKSVNLLLPSLFREDHCNAINKYMKEKINSKLSESRRVIGISIGKTGFIFPVTMTLNYLPSITGEFTLGVLVKKEKQLFYMCHIISNKNLDILYVSSECLKLLYLKEKDLWSIKNFNKIRKEERINLKYLIKELSEDDNTLTDYEPQKNFKVHIIQYDSLAKRRKSICIMYLKIVNKNQNLPMTNMNEFSMNYSEMMMGSKSLDLFLIRIEVLFKGNNISMKEIKLKDIRIFHYDPKSINIIIKNKNKSKSILQQI